jgi:hypothetical protein
MYNFQVAEPEMHYFQVAEPEMHHFQVAEPEMHHFDGAGAATSIRLWLLLFLTLSTSSQTDILDAECGNVEVG